MNHQKKTNLWKTRHKILLGLLMGALILSSIGWMGSMRAQAVSLTDTNMSLTVSLGEVIDSKDLPTDSVVFDLYKIADAAPVEGYDTYTYDQSKISFAAEVPVTVSELTGDYNWEAIKEAAVAHLLDPDVTVEPTVKGAQIGTAVEILTEAGEGPGPGAYLVVIRGQNNQQVLMEDKKEYVSEVEKTIGEETKKVTVTLATGVDNIYQFEPTLVSIPDKSPVVDENGNEIKNTANQVDWEYDVQVNLKYDKEPRLGDLRVIKKFSGEDFIPATIVLRVSFEVPEGVEPIPEEIHSMTFKTPEEAKDGNQILLKDIPVHTKVTVTEEYPGAGYVIVAPEGGTATIEIEADEQIEVEFENKLDKQLFGLGIINNFTWSEGRWVLVNPETN